MAKVTCQICRVALAYQSEEPQYEIRVTVYSLPWTLAKIYVYVFVCV